MTNEVEGKKSGPEQVLKEITEGEMKKEEMTEESVKTSSSGRKKLLVFAIIGLLVIIGIYYTYEFVLSLK